MIYGTRSNGNSHGLVITKPVVVDVMLDRVGYTYVKDLRNIKVIEPAAGDGAFAISIIDRLHKSSKNHNFSFHKALANLVFFEIDEDMANLLKERIESKLNAYNQILPEGLIRKEDFLLSNEIKCDLVIGNPPYVRHENIPNEQKKLYRETFSTFTHRSDLYIAFYEKSLSSLKECGTLSFICSNRWLKNQYGKNLRELIHLSFSLKEIIDLEGINPFEENVIAYPAITTIRKVSSNAKGTYYKIREISQLVDFDLNEVKQRTLNVSNSSNWFPYVVSGAKHEKFLDSIESQGFKIGIGVATGSDKVFIRKDFDSLVEEELLLPILLSKDLRNNKFRWSGNHILNPFDANGTLIDLDKFPKAKEYLNSNRQLLEKRHVAKKNPKLWYKTIDRIKPNLTIKDKIVLPDISGNKFLHIDRGEFYPHHNLYYITGNNYRSLVLLSTILMSNFVRNQLLDLGTKMNGGYPRWQSQNLKKLKIPLISSIPSKTSNDLINAYHSLDYARINALINENEISKYDFHSGQTKLFEPKSGEYKSKLTGKNT